VTTAEKYVAAAYLVAFLAVLAYVLIIALKLTRLERELGELEALAAAPSGEEAASPQIPTPVTANVGAASGGEKPGV
jgi:CcmD family protein